MVRLFCALIALCLLCWAAAAKKVGGVALTLPPPAGYCELNQAHPGDARMLTVVGELVKRGGNRLLAMSAECRQLDDCRAGRRPLLANYSQYQTIKAWENSSLPVAPADIIKKTCQGFRAQGKNMMHRMLPEIQRHYDEALTTAKVNEAKFLGVLGEDATACYASLLQRMRAEDGAEVTQVAVLATTVVKNKIIFYYLFAPYTGAQGVTDQLAEVRRHVAALYGKNR